jgi:hypothetical protein
MVRSNVLKSVILILPGQQPSHIAGLSIILLGRLQ